MSAGAETDARVVPATAETDARVVPATAETDVRVVLATAPDAQVAARIARALVEERLVACVNVVAGVRSIYRWQGAVEEAAEQLLVMKTRADRCAALAARVQALHPYALPEVLVLPVSGGSQRYLDWVLSESALESSE